MGLDPSDIEGFVNGIYWAAKVERDQPRGAIYLARKLLGEDAVRLAWNDGLVTGDAALVYEWDRPRVYVRHRLSDARLNIAVGHELSEWALDCEGYEEDDRERVADAIAAGLVLPREAFLPTFRDYGFDLAGLAECFTVPEGVVALRIGETTEHSIALVKGTRVDRRDARRQLPDDAELVCLARQTLDPWYPLHVHRLSDDPGATAFRPVAGR